MGSTLYLARHATPDWSRTDIRYDIPPGPPLTPAGEKEAVLLGHFLRSLQVAGIYSSPLERTQRTARLAAEITGHGVITNEAIAEWRHGESEEDVLARMCPIIDAFLDESERVGPLVLVTHGGPIRMLLQALAVPSAEISFYRRQFDHDNPVPPAGVWRVTRVTSGEITIPELVFTPGPITRYVPDVVQV
jgi:broad specificity phosphatase PhoE